MPLLASAVVIVACPLPNGKQALMPRRLAPRTTLPVAWVRRRAA